MPQSSNTTTTDRMSGLSRDVDAVAVVVGRSKVTAAGADVVMLPLRVPTCTNRGPPSHPSIHSS